MALVVIRRKVRGEGRSRRVAVVVVQPASTGMDTMGAARREGGAGPEALGIACPMPWCGRAALEYGTYSRKTRRRCHSPRART